MISVSEKRKLKVAGFDMGRNYIAWAVLRGDSEVGFVLHRHGTVLLPDLGDTTHFGGSLSVWRHFFQWFVLKDLRPTAWAVERFTYRPGSQGAAAEDINLRIPEMLGPGAYAVRNTDWKSWFGRTVSKDGTHGFFHTPTEHEADAAGIALYLGSVILPRAQRLQVPPVVRKPTLLSTSQGPLFGPDWSKRAAQ